MDMQLIELATSLNRFRSLEPVESRWLEGAIRREMRRGGQNLKERWPPKDDLALKRLVRRGKTWREIARILGRSELAVGSRIRSLRRIGKIPPRSQSPVAQMPAGEG